MQRFLNLEEYLDEKNEENLIMATILVDPNLCNCCGICSSVCAMSIITKTDEEALPNVEDAKAAICIKCGHCEAFCPSGALVLNFRADEKDAMAPGVDSISPEAMALHLKKRRSVRRFTKDLVPREKILEILDAVRYAASGVNAQPVQWLIIHDPDKVRMVARLTIEWLKGLQGTAHPLSSYAPVLISGWEKGNDVICRGAPHLLIALIPESKPAAPTDAIIALTHFDVAAPAFGIGTCWAGFVAHAATSHEPLKKALGLPQGWKCAYAMMFGYPLYRTYAIPRRNPLKATWL